MLPGTVASKPVLAMESPGEFQTLLMPGHSRGEGGVVI